jgi:hypothetical protein
MNDRDERHTIFGRWIAEELLDRPLDTSVHEGTIWDVAGGKGHLSAALADMGFSCALVDPCALDGRELCSAGFFATTDVHQQASLHHRPPQNQCQSERDFLVFRQTLRELLDASGGEELVNNCAAIVGLHPDEATEDIVDAALARQIPFAVVPCCVMPQLFPWRRLASGVRVKKLGSFVAYLLEKDPRIRVARLPIQGRNEVAFMRKTDYQLPLQVVVPPVLDYGPCIAAVRAGDLTLLQELRRQGQPWNEECCYQAAWGGHLTVLQWAREKGCPWDRAAVIGAATRGKHPKLLEWAHAQH